MYSLHVGYASYTANFITRKDDREGKNGDSNKMHLANAQLLDDVL